MPGMTYDHHGGDHAHRPDPGDLLVTERLVYRILDVRPVDSRVWPDRWKLRLERLATRKDWDGRAPDGAALIHVRCYRRGEGPHDNACESPTCEGCAP